MVETPSVDDLTKEIARLRIKLSAAEAKLAVAMRTATGEDSSGTNVYATGDRVRIINKIVQPAHYKNEWDDVARERERQATVTHIVTARPKTPTQVRFLTDI